MTANQPAPLTGVRVLDLTWGMTGAFATMLLGDHGADVVRVERRGTSASTRSSTRTWDRNKRLVALDLEDAADRDLLAEMADGADVILDGLGPGRAREIGIDPEALRRARPSLIYCTLSGFGLDTKAPDAPCGYDLLAAAALGVMAESPGLRDGPIFPAHPAHCYSTGFVAAIGIVAALRARLVTGEGDALDVSFTDGVLGQMAMNWWSERGLSFVAARSRDGGLDMGRRRMLLQTYECGDGKLIKIHTGAAGAFGRAMQALGVADRITTSETALETASELSDADLEILRSELPAVLRSADSSVWLERLWAAEVAALPLQPPGAVFDDDQLAHAGVMTLLDDPELGSLRVVGPVIRLSDSPPVAPRPLRAGSASEWVASGLGATLAPRPLDAPLAGIRILEFANWFASPYGNRLLSDLGADVIKVEALQGDPIRPLPDPCEGANRGKRSLAIDLKSSHAQPVLTRLIEDADVVQHNLRPGAAERLGIDEVTARSLNPDVIYAYAPGYGSSGPKSHLQSFAPLLSGFVGLNHISAGEGNPPVGTFGNEDYYNGLLSALAILLALVHRERTGRGQLVETPQLHSSVLVTSEWFEHDGVLRCALPRLDHEQMGWHWSYRVFQCLEGWIALSCTSDAQRRSLTDVVLPGALPSAADGAVAGAVAGALTDAFFGDRAAAWSERLRAAGVPCAVVREDAWLPTFLLDDDMVKAGRVFEIEHPLHGRVRVIGPLFHFDVRPARVRGRSPLLGEHTDDVLAEVGTSPEDVLALRAAGVI